MTLKSYNCICISHTFYICQLLNFWYGSLSDAYWTVSYSVSPSTLEESLSLNQTAYCTKNALWCLMMIMFRVVISYSSHVFMCTSTDSNNCLWRWLTVYIEIQLFVNCYHGNKLTIVQILLEQLCCQSNESHFPRITFWCWAYLYRNEHS